MKTEWDYTNLADSYLKRPDYAKNAIDEMLKTACVTRGNWVCDVGAGAAHLTKMLANENLIVHAVEPNDAMRKNGIKITQKYNNVSWYEGTGEHTGMNENTYDLVTFGSSFNVCNREEALEESQRILKENGWFACMWNHRDLDDPIQKEIENILKTNIENYSYGSRREDQTEVICSSGLFKDVIYIERSVNHSILAEDFIEGWKSHGTVYRQAPDKFYKIIDEIKCSIQDIGKEYIEIPYSTRIWMAQCK